MTRAVSAVRRRQGSGKAERRSSRGQPEGSVWLEAHIYCWQEGKSELVDEACVCVQEAASACTHRPTASGGLSHEKGAASLRHLPRWPLPCYMPTELLPQGHAAPMDSPPAFANIGNAEGGGTAGGGGGGGFTEEKKREEEE